MSSATLLVASPRGFNSTSFSLGSYLLDKLEEAGYDVNKHHVQSAHHQQIKEKELLASVADCDLLVVAFPLYIDCLPAPLILMLEKIADQRKNNSVQKPQRMVAIVNNGFPEAAQNNTALAICRQFAQEAGIAWAGGLSLGGGGVIHGASLKEAGYIARNVVKALDLAAVDLLADKPLSEAAVACMAKPTIPRWLFLLAANRGWKGMAKKYGAEKKLKDKPKQN